MPWTKPWTWVRLLASVLVLAVLVHRLGAAPFLDVARRIDVRLVALAIGIAAVTTLCAGWRWTLVAKGLGARLPLATAVAGCYRSQLLNSMLPGGVLGDVHRGVRQGRLEGGVGHGLRTVWWERSAGQVVQAVLTVVALLVLPSPLQPSPVVAAALLAGVVLAGAALLRLSGRRSRPGAVVRAVVTDVRCGLLASRIWPGVLATSVVVVAGHVATFVLAARAAGATAPLTTLLPMTLLVLVAAGLPVNIAGWGPREGAAAWLFGAAGVEAATGVGASAVYGVLALVATAPGAILLARDAVHRRQDEETVAQAPISPARCGRGIGPMAVAASPRLQTVARG
jgi:uncharacterized membrane protein YbhN (UPF0104 family)